MNHNVSIVFVLLEIFCSILDKERYDFLRTPSSPNDREPNALQEYKKKE